MLNGDTQCNDIFNLQVWSWNSGFFLRKWRKYTAKLGNLLNVVIFRFKKKKKLKNLKLYSVSVYIEEKHQGQASSQQFRLGTRLVAGPKDCLLTASIQLIQLVGFLSVCAQAHTDNFQSLKVILTETCNLPLTVLLDKIEKSLRKIRSKSWSNSSPTRICSLDPWSKSLRIIRRPAVEPK